MKLVLALCALLLAAQTACAATPQELWEAAQKNTPVVSTQPHKMPMQPTAPSVPVVVNKQETAEEPAKGQTAVEQTPAEQPIEKQTTVEPTASEQPKKEQTATAPATVANQNTAPQVTTAPKAPAKPKRVPKLLVKKPPLPRQFLRTPQAADFTRMTSNAGYSILLPKAFGSDPLAGLPNAQGAMSVRTAGDALLCAVNIIDPSDTTSYQSTEPLPDYPDKRNYLHWEHGMGIVWDCTLSQHKDYHGDKLLLTAHTTHNGKTYELLYVMPRDKRNTLLPQAIASMDSMKIL